ncbi:transketolase [Acidithrix sp. C25]|uniref:transketolase n=1 Tax=Acidithrix sp. C25 TaxID=1671482 RepID=UPI00191BB5A6|nr:transketolase [Acidithrix sp. C25]CAG4920634.1 unnamed protein product [Acidithrix sp. C25]
MTNDNDQLCVTALRMLSIDQVEHANSGHPGLPLGLAPAAYTLFSRVLKHAPSDPTWADRDRFVLSAGHGSALVYSLLHLFGYGLEVQDLQGFRQLGSKTPGHPEYHHTTGVEMTTGPLGQGISSAVGMALAEAMMASRVDAAGAKGVIDHHTYVFASDGDLMEGISHEAGSLAGHLGLNKLIVLFDSNNITITGDATLSCTDNIRGRFESYGWNTILVEDHEDLDLIESAFNKARENTGGPTLIELRTVIGYGAPTKAGKSSVHGSALGAKEIAGTKEFYKWTYPPFEVPQAIYDHARSSVQKGEKLAAAWRERYKELSNEVRQIISPVVPSPGEIAGSIKPFSPDKALATRISSKEVLIQLSEALPFLIGGSADLAESTGTNLGLDFVSSSNYLGREINFGIREHGMAALLNGIALHGGFVAYGSTFLVFSDYCRPSVRLAAIMGLGVNFVFTHDSIAVGEDGPTHEPVEHLAALRAIPNLRVMRPADANETAAAWATSIGDPSMPSVLVLSRQGLPTVTTHGDPAWVNDSGMQIISDPQDARGVIISSGSEVVIALEAAEILKQNDGISVRVVSVMWRERFLDVYRGRIEALTSGLPTLVVEAGIPLGWEPVVASEADIIAMHSYGASGKGSEVQAHFGFSGEKVAQSFRETLSRIESTKKDSHDLEYLNANLVLERNIVLACVDAAKASFSKVGRGDRNSADSLAVGAMRRALNKAPIALEVVIGEGEKDEAPMLYRGERLGSGAGPTFDIAVDPLEGTNYVAKGQPGAVSVIAAAPRGTFKYLPGYYMDKMVVGSRAKGALTLSNSIESNVEALAKVLDKSIGEIEIVVLDKPRHKELISRIRKIGARVREIPDGDVMGAFEVLVGHIDALFGIGGAPEGIIMAAMTKALGGEFQGQLTPQSDAERAQIISFDASIIDTVFDQDALILAEPVVAITSVTGAGVLEPVTYRDGSLYISSALIRNGSYSVVSQFA